MIAYWAMFIVAAIGVFAPRLPKRQSTWMWFLVGAGFAVIMGFRHEVGADWFNYEAHFHRVAVLDAREVLAQGDPAYYLLNWLMARVGADVHWVNALCAAILALGTVALCRIQPSPWLALLAAVPYLLVVVGMGYTRQSAALGLVMLGLAHLSRGRTLAFVLLVAAGALFHKSAVLLLPVAALAASRHRWLTAGLVLLVTATLYYLLLDDSAERLWVSYVEARLESEGAAVRIAMNAVPATVLLVFARRLVPDAAERRLWCWMAVLALACIPLTAFASTAVDRVALYLIPLQMFVFSRLPLLSASPRDRAPLVVGLVAYFAAVLFTWLNFASHAPYWLPYRFMPLG